MSQYNARIVEKDIFDLTAVEGGNSETVDLNFASKFSCQAVYVVAPAAGKTFDSGEVEIDTFTFQAQADTDAGDYLVVYDTEGNAWAAAADITGTDPEPTGDVWVAIPAARKTQVDLSAATTDATVAAAFETALNALTDFPFVAADSTADVACTQDLRGVLSAPEVHNEDDSGAGSIAVAVTNAGVNSEVDVDADTITIPSHGYLDGYLVQLTSTGTLPSPLTTATDYFVIVVNANTIQLAESLEDALDGVAIDIEDQGSDGAVNTSTGESLSGASVTFQKSNDGEHWVNIQSATSITNDGTVFISQPNVSYRYFRAVKAISAGAFDLAALTLVIGDSI